MSFEDDLKKLGDDVSNLVDNAINSQNFQQLNQKITDSINQLVYPRKTELIRILRRTKDPTSSRSGAIGNQVLKTAEITSRSVISGSLRPGCCAGICSCPPPMSHFSADFKQP